MTFRFQFILTAIASVIVIFATQNSAALSLGLNWKAEPQFGGFYTASLNGHFQKENLEVDIQEGGSGTPTIQMIATGKLDYAIVSADELIVAYDRGAQDIVALFATYQTNPQGIMVHADQKNIQSLEDVFKSSGLLLWQSGLPYAQFIKKKWPQIKRQQVPYSGGLSVYLNQSDAAQQCFVTSEPLTAKKSNKPAQTFLIAESGYNPYTTVLVTQKSRLKKNIKQVEAVVRAVRSGWIDYLKDPKPTNQLMGRLNKSMDAETFEESAKAQKPLIQEGEKSPGHMTKERWETLQNQLHDLQIVKSKQDPTEFFRNL